MRKMTNTTETENKENRTPYEIRHGLVSRNDLRKNILSLFDGLDVVGFHQLYDLLWTMKTNQTMIKMTNDERRILEEQLKTKGDKQ